MTAREAELAALQEALLAGIKLSFGAATATSAVTDTDVMTRHLKHLYAVRDAYAAVISARKET